MGKVYHLLLALVQGVAQVKAKAIRIRLLPTLVQLLGSLLLLLLAGLGPDAVLPKGPMNLRNRKDS